MSKKKARLQPIQIYQLLPRTNCKLCGYPTCYAFAFALLGKKERPIACPVLSPDALSKVNRLLSESLGAGEIIEGTDFMIDKEKCTGCGDCVVVCSKALTTISLPGRLVQRGNVPPVLQVVDGVVQVIKWDSCKRTLEEVNLCSVCQEKCPFGALELVKQ